MNKYFDSPCPYMFTADGLMRCDKVVNFKNRSSCWTYKHNNHLYKKCRIYKEEKIKKLKVILK